MSLGCTDIPRLSKFDSPKEPEYVLNAKFQVNRILMNWNRNLHIIAYKMIYKILKSVKNIKSY